MSRTALKYAYLVLGTALATLALLGSIGEAHRRAERNENRSAASYMHEEDQEVKRRGEAREPMEAATFRANELVRRPLRTVGLLVGYQVLFVGAAACAVFTDEITSVVGEDIGFIAKLVGFLVSYPVPESLVPLLLPAGVVLGLLFALVIHQSLKTAGDIRRAAAT